MISLASNGEQQGKISAQMSSLFDMELGCAYIEYKKWTRFKQNEKFGGLFDISSPDCSLSAKIHISVYMQYYVFL